MVLSPPAEASPLSADERALGLLIAETVGATLHAWRPLRTTNAAESDRADWFHVGTLGPDDQSDSPVLPEKALQAASCAEGPIVAAAGPDRRLVATRLGHGSDVVAIAEFDAAFADRAVQLVARTADLHRARQRIGELEAENESFAVQMIADLEELTLLRSVVERYSSSRVDDSLTSMAAATLPMVNETIRAECLALFRVPNPDDPSRAEVAVTEGDAVIGHGALVDLVRCYAPSAIDSPYVKNWDADDLPESAVDGDVAKVVCVRSLILTPLRSSGRTLGWLAAVNRKRSAGAFERSWQLASDEFGSGEGSLLATTASVLATHAANLDLIHEKEQLMVSVVRSLVSAIESKDKYTRGHSERVALYSRRIAEQLGYTNDNAECLYLSALLHDVGKIGVRDAILTKDGRLTDEEYAEVSRHPDEGWAILCDLEQLRHVLPGVLHHHERWDGRGYPDGLAGEAIPLDGRVMAVADAYDAMTSDRSYRQGMPTERAESILREGAGDQWDPACIDAFFTCLDDIHRLKQEYQETDRRTRERTETRDEFEALPHAVAGLND